MAKKLFSIRFTSLRFEQTGNPELHVCSNYDAYQMTKNINSILEPQNLIYRDDNPLSYHYNGGALIVTGLADVTNPNTPDFII